MNLSPQACRTVIEMALGQYKDYWEMNKVKWRYHIEERREGLVTNVKISFSINGRTPVAMIMNSYVHEDDKIARKSCWNRLLVETTQMGAAKMYETTIQLVREGRLANEDGSELGVKHYPLTPDEVNKEYK